MINYMMDIIPKAKSQIKLNQRIIALTACTIVTAVSVFLLSQTLYTKIQQPLDIKIVAVSINGFAGIVGCIGMLSGSLLYNKLLKGRKISLETHLILDEWKCSKIEPMINVLYDYAKKSRHITAVTFDATVGNLLCAEALLYISMITTFCNSANILFIYIFVPKILDRYVDNSDSHVINSNCWYGIVSSASITFSMISIAVILTIMIIVSSNERIDKRKCIVSMLNIGIPIGTKIASIDPKCRATILLAVDTAIEEAAGHNTEEIRNNISKTIEERLSGEVRMINYKKYVNNNKYYWRPLYDSKLLRTNEIEYPNRHRYLATRAVNACYIGNKVFNTENSDFFITSQLLKSDASIKHTGKPVFNRASCQSIANADNDTKKLLRHLSELKKSRAALKNKLGAHKSIIWYLNAFVLITILWASTDKNLYAQVIDVIMGIVVTFITAAWPPMINDVFYMFNHWNASKDVEITCCDLNERYGFSNLRNTCKKLLEFNGKEVEFSVQNTKIEEHDWHQLRIIDSLSTVIVLKSKICNKYLCYLKDARICNLDNSYCCQNTKCCLWILEKENNCVRIRHRTLDEYLYIKSHGGTFDLTVCNLTSCKKSSLWQLHYLCNDESSKFMLFNYFNKKYLGYDNDANFTLLSSSEVTQLQQKWTIEEVFNSQNNSEPQEIHHISQCNVVRFNSSELFNIIEVSQDEDTLAQAMRVFMT